MTGHRYTVISLARPRTPWTERITGWAAEATLPIELTKALSATELSSRLANGLRPSAVMIDSAYPGVDRDLIHAARESGSLVAIVNSGTHRRAWDELGADAVIEAEFDDHALLNMLETAASMARATELRSVDAIAADGHATTTTEWAGRLVAVCGGSGMGASTVAQLLSQGASLQPEYAGRVCLIDLAANSHQALFHHTGDVLPGLQELVDVFRATTIDPAGLASFVWSFDHVAYDVVLGLRRTRDWTAITPAALAATITALRQRYRLVIADIDADFDGEVETGSIDLEERNVRSRHTIEVADLVLLVTTADLKGIHESVALGDRLQQADVPSDRVLRVINQAPRSPRARARLAAELASFDDHSPRRPPIFIETKSAIETSRRAAMHLPDQMARRLADSAIGLLDLQGTNTTPQTETVAAAATTSAK